ncbi:MAG: RNA 2',3'-cyclic phosphodiesterase [Gammaproteobacteria bacterium]|nr:RNA 2',3'-cyclic phosphodiesterase [Gammaproteobacteria bacterium]
MGETGDNGRYFLAAWPDDAVRDRLARWADAIPARSPARRVPADNLHITLVFLGPLDPPRLNAVRAVAVAAPWSGASLKLDRIGYWKRARIVWAGSSEGSEALSALAETLRSRLRRLGFRIETRPFVPHVTLYRKAGRRPRWRPEVIDWRIQRFCLVRSTLSSSGSRYEIVERW